MSKPLTNAVTVDMPIGPALDSTIRIKQAVTPQGKPSQTHFQPLDEIRDSQLVEVRPLTGRTHQIRVHLHSIGLPVVGDPLYGTSRRHRLKSMDDEIRYCLKFFKRQALHAHRLGFVHPRSGIEMEFKSPLPEDYRKLINLLNGERYCQTV